TGDNGGYIYPPVVVPYVRGTCPRVSGTTCPSSRCSGETRRYLEEHRWRRRHLQAHAVLRSTRAIRAVPSAPGTDTNIDFAPFARVSAFLTESGLASSSSAISWIERGPVVLMR